MSDYKRQYGLYCTGQIDAKKSYSSYWLGTGRGSIPVNSENLLDKTYVKKHANNITKKRLYWNPQSERNIGRP